MFGGQANCIAIQKDGKILAGGTYNFSTSFFNYIGTGFTLLQLNSDGKFDSSFGINGIDSISIQTNPGGINALTIQPDGKIIAAGVLDTTNYVPFFALVRFNTNGALDSSFGSNGIDTVSGTLITPSSVALQNDGKIVVGGSGGGGNSSTFAIARYNTNGTLDNSFEIKNVVVDGNSFAYAMALQSDGKIIEAGESDGTTNINFAMVRYLSNGSLDNTFGVNGLDTTNFGNQTFSMAYAIQLVNSRIYLAGTTNLSNSPENAWTIAAYKNNASALPVTLLNFDGVLRNNEALLTWSTANETNNKGFKIQKSLDARTFTDIVFIDGNRKSSGVNSYNFTDEKMTGGSNYYRLKQIDMDGKFAYSSVIKLDYSKFNWAILGNPSKSNSSIQLQLNEAANVSIQILSINGSVIQTISKGNIQKGNYIIPLNLSNASSGMYMVKLMVNNNSYSRDILK